MHTKFSEMVLSWQWMPAILGLELLCFKRMSMKSNILFVTSLRNFKRVRKIIAIVKELLALVLAPKHIEMYMSSGGYSVTVNMDHNLLTFSIA